MPDLDLLAVLCAAVLAFVLSGVYYGVLGTGPIDPDAPALPGWLLPAVELPRNLVLATVVAGLAAEMAVGSVVGGLLLGVVLWVGFPLVLWTGAVAHEGTPRRAAARHAGDWLLKLVAVAVVVAAWPW